MEICAHNLCTGCYACVSICPHDCITMQEDIYGELHPFIDEKKCVHCGACMKTCPNNITQQFHYPLVCYASWITNKEKRNKCASGGIGTIMSEYVVCQGGVVFGSRYDENFTPIMANTECIADLDKFKGSRYVQSVVGADTFFQVRNFLKNGRKVLFIGTPCQIAGLKSFLKKDYETLVTVDLICHGCTPTKYFKEELYEICSKKHFSELCDVRFRGNDGNNFAFSIWGGKKGKRGCSPGENVKLLYRQKGYTSYYLGGFLLGVTLRGNCYTCNYARPERISDITIGDFIGLGKEIPFNYSVSNVSSVIVNTKKGYLFYRGLSETMPELINIERSYEERLKYKPSLVEPFAKHPFVDSFRSAYLKGGYVYASRKVLALEVKKAEAAEIKANIKRTMRIPSRVVRKVCKEFFTFLKSRILIDS